MYETPTEPNPLRAAPRPPTAADGPGVVGWVRSVLQQVMPWVGSQGGSAGEGGLIARRRPNPLPSRCPSVGCGRSP